MKLINAMQESNPVLDSLLSTTTYINPQHESPLFSRLPRELRDQIYAYALLDTQQDPFLPRFPARIPLLTYPSNESAATQSPSTPYNDSPCTYYRLPADHAITLRPIPRHVIPWLSSWPPSPGRQPHDIALPLLRTCRAVYLETHALPLSLNAVPFYHRLDFALRLDTLLHPFPDQRLYSYPYQTFTHAFPYQLPHLRALDYTLKQTELENANFADSHHQRANEKFPLDTWSSIAAHVKLLRIRIEHTDWAAKGDEALALEPCTSYSHSQAFMQQCAQARRTGRLGEVALPSQGDWRQPGGWGGAVERDFPALGEFELVLEAVQARKGELEEVVRCAQTWVFESGEVGMLRYAAVEQGSWGKEDCRDGVIEVRVLRWKRTRV
ncbi:uncharacterized protein BDZ99DRAFT_248242 [Mytilinidion resinicola]|uniref:Uncharacterized protein n=1 Tax=Mytilinidion resinicola TaxID=574789 RepID=A0A6A6YYG8_9PEZI|nr:uncharacterized protein BDZ99DRAFT_248242 [Mytilinidion resinicola]KAF2813044.1 hypothetical protein BDZ99DRAFT_248242 [Mytilinidion resinicola]